MNQQEKDWLDLGQQLKDYQPEGNPGADFLDFQQLQKEEESRPIVWWFGVLLLLPLLLILLTAGYYWYDTPAAIGPLQGRVASSLEAPSLPELAPQDAGSLTLADQEAERPNAGKGVVSEGKAFSQAGEHVSSPPPANEVAVVSGPVGESHPTKQLALLPAERPVPIPRGEGDSELISVNINANTPESSPLSPSENASVPGVEQRSPGPGFAPQAEVEAVDKEIHRLTMAATTGLAVLPISELPVGTELPVSPPAPVDGKHKNLRFLLGTGLSNHWRGESFLQDIDRGLYANVGVYQPLGQRFGVEARIGYRGHDMQFPVLSDAKEPWSYHKDEIHNTGDMGQLRVYTYEGVVEGYRAVEFSLLMHYQLLPKIGIHAGARYALPSIKFRRVVHGPDDENPFHDFIEGQAIVKYKDYGALMGLNYRLTNHLSLQGEIHLGMVDLIENAAQEGDRFNRSNSLSIGVRYSID